MARINEVSLIGTVVNTELDPKTVSPEKTDGQNNMEVLNFLVRCYNEYTGRVDTLPVAVWGENLVRECLMFMKKDDLVYINGELRYKTIWNHELKRPERIYTTVKASTVEFLSKKLKDQKLYDDKFGVNDVKLAGNLVEDPRWDGEGFILAVDRLHPSKDLKVPNHKLTDYVTIVVKDESCIRGPLKKGSVAIVEGSLMSRKRDDERIGFPRIVVDAKKIVGR